MEKEQQVATPIFERGLTSEVSSLLESLDGDDTMEEITGRIGVITLADGRKAQIHLTITTNKADFLELVP